jgi:hypothetical protein
VPQGAVAIQGYYRWLNNNAVDVQAGATVAEGTLVISGDGLANLRADRPNYNSDGSAVGFRQGDSCGSFKELPASPPPASLGTPLIDPYFPLGFTCVFAWSKTPANSDAVLYNEWDISTAQVYSTTAGSSEAGDPLLYYDPSEIMLDLKWLPDGSGFVFSLTENGQSRSNLWEYTAVDKGLHQITFFTDEIAGHFSLSPDGQHLVFERAADLESAVSLWIVDRDGGNLHQLVADGARPAWGQPLQLDQHLFIPLAMR